jgi:uncharacterized protein YidB (DUF937 family)
MNFKSLATQVLMDHIEGANNSNRAAAALDRLADGNKAFDLGDLVSRLQAPGGEIAGKTRSWLGDGKNESISASQLEKAVGAHKTAAFALALGIDREHASNKLTQILPDLIDKSSQGGELLNKIGSRRGFTGLASRFWRKSA